MKVIITHGTGGSPSGNWFPWLSKQLSALGHSVVVPQYPTPSNQNLTNWLAAFEKEFELVNLNDDCILIGHSIGVAFTLRLLEQITKPVKACFLVAGFTHQLGLPDFDPLNESFIPRKIAWRKLRAVAGKVFVYHSENDPYVPLKYGEEIAQGLGSKLTEIPGGGHLNSETGYTKFEEMLRDLKLVLK